ncbi:hypothetical protein GBAR_LOCUS9532 [Geodia barretti]|nr:hypothetical protein GBAR_LOCUS9532 [Geodia barretti]
MKTTLAKGDTISAQVDDSDGSQVDGQKASVNAQHHPRQLHDNKGSPHMSGCGRARSQKTSCCGAVQQETCSSHFLEQGSIEHPSTYGLFATAAVSSFPPLVLTRAFEIEQKLQHSSYVNLDCSQSGSDAIKLASLLIQTSENSSLKNVDLQKYFHYAAFLFRCCSKI